MWTETPGPGARFSDPQPVVNVSPPLEDVFDIVLTLILPARI